jgi:hypothetical protein
MSGISVSMKQKPRMGRPPLPPGQRKTTQLTVSVRKGEKAMLEVAARKRGVTVSELLMQPWREGRP